MRKAASFFLARLPDTDLHQCHNLYGTPNSMPPSRSTEGSRTRRKVSPPASGKRFEAVRIDSLFKVLDAIAWIESPTSSQIAQFANIDPRTAGKLVKNARQIGLIDSVGNAYVLSKPYPYKGSKDQKQAVVKESLVKLTLLTSVRQFVQLGDTLEDALRKAATIEGISPFVPADLHPLIQWAQTLGALNPSILPEDLLDAATSQKEIRHREDKSKRIAFLSHSSADKPFIRQLAADLTSKGVGVWLDEQRIHVGDSIPDRIAQGLAESDFFLIAMSENSSKSEWVRKELNGALMNEVQRRKVHILPLKLDDSPLPDMIKDKKYADFSRSYKTGFEDLLVTLRNDLDD